MAVAMQYGGGAMQFEHILEIAAHILDMVPFIVFGIRQINATTKDLNTSKVKRISTSVFQFQSELAEKLNKVWVKTNITYDIISLVGNDKLKMTKE